MKLFVPDGMVLDASAPGHKEIALQLGMQAEHNMLAVLEQHGITARLVGTVRKAMRTLDSQGALAYLKEWYDVLVRLGKAQEP